MAFEIDKPRLNQVAQHGHEVIGATNALATIYNKAKELGVPLKAKALIPLTGISAVAVALYKDQSCSKSRTCDATQQIVTYSIYFLFLTTFFVMTIYAVHGCRGRKKIEDRLENIEVKLVNIVEQVDATVKRVDTIDGQLNQLVKSTEALATATSFLYASMDQVGRRITQIEGRSLWSSIFTKQADPMPASSTATLIQAAPAS